MNDRWGAVSSWEPGGARVSACTLQLLESSQGQEKGDLMGVDDWLKPVQQIASFTVGGGVGRAKICLRGWLGDSWCAFSYANVVKR